MQPTTTTPLTLPTAETRKEATTSSEPESDNRQGIETPSIETTKSKETPAGPSPPEAENPNDLRQWETAVPYNLVSERNNSNPVLNLSSRLLSTHEMEVLVLGLKFAPTPQKVPDPLEYFQKYHDQCQRQYNRLINRPSTDPLPNLIEEHLSAIASRLSDLPKIKQHTDEEKQTQWNNLSNSHKAALSNLRKDKSITIKPADRHLHSGSRHRGLSAARPQRIGRQEYLCLDRRRGIPHHCNKGQ